MNSAEAYEEARKKQLVAYAAKKGCHHAIVLGRTYEFTGIASGIITAVIGTYDIIANSHGKNWGFAFLGAIGSGLLVYVGYSMGNMAKKEYRLYESQERQWAAKASQLSISYPDECKGIEDKIQQTLAEKTNHTGGLPEI